MNEYSSFFARVGKDLDKDELDILNDALFRILGDRRTIDISTESILEKRITYPQLHLRQASNGIASDEHVMFRVLAKSIFGVDEPHLMRACVGAQLKTFRYFYEHSLFNGNLDQNHRNIVDGDLVLDPRCIQMCADLFQVSFFCINMGGMNAIAEYAPRSEKILNDPDLLAKHEDFTSKKDFWLIIDTTMTGVWQTLVPGGTNAYAPDNKRLDSIRRMIGGPENQLVLECQNLVDSEDGNGVLVTRNEKKNLDSRINRLGFKKVSMVGDGNCVPRGLSHLVFGDQKHHPLIRKLVIAKISEDRPRYEFLCNLRKREGPSEKNKIYFEKESWEEYLKRMARNGEWCGNGFTQAVVDMFYLKLVRLYARGNVVMKEVMPETGYSYGTIFCCQTALHLDVMEKQNV